VTATAGNGHYGTSPAVCPPPDLPPRRPARLYATARRGGEAAGAGRWPVAGRC